MSHEVPEQGFVGDTAIKPELEEEGKRSGRLSSAQWRCRSRQLLTPGLQGSSCSAFSSASGQRPSWVEPHVFSEAWGHSLSLGPLGPGCCLAAASADRVKKDVSCGRAESSVLSIVHSVSGVRSIWRLCFPHFLSGLSPVLFFVH